MSPIETPSAEVQTAWAALLDALARAGYAVDELVRPGAPTADIDGAERSIGRSLPADLSGLYQLSDGQTDYYDLTHGAHAEPFASKDAGYARCSATAGVSTR